MDAPRSSHVFSKALQKPFVFRNLDHKVDVRGVRRKLLVLLLEAKSIPSKSSSDVSPFRSSVSSPPPCLSMSYISCT